jgi:acyl-CoA synthetase (AMP-forming)/AMP-acid ligase II
MTRRSVLEYAAAVRLRYRAATKREGIQLTADELIAWCAERLARFRVPEFVEFRAEFPRTSVGKIQKHLLRASG